MNENEIRDVLGEGIGEEPPVVGGPTAVFAGARTRVVRTRAVTGALSVVAVLGVTAGAVAVSGGSGGAGSAATANRGVAPGAAGTTSWSPVVAPATPSTPTTSTSTKGEYVKGGSRKPAPDPGAGQVLTDGRSVDEIVKSGLPSGLTAGNYEGQDSYRPSEMGVAANASMSVDDGTGKLTTVYAGITQNQGFAFRDTNCTTLVGMGGGITDCHLFPQPDGSVILTYREDEASPDTNGPTAGSYQWTVERAFPNGTAISISANNYFDPLTDPHEKGWHVNPSRKDPLLTVDQLKTILADSRWALTVPAEFAQQAENDLVPYKDITQK